uniref:T9SS type A sorting domain-containing protein n=1 Tax=candidate division WOR-3 bacterium TaxID=2052148 RepID=A0A7C3YPM2_UNCW3
MKRCFELILFFFLFSSGKEIFFPGEIIVQFSPEVRKLLLRDKNNFLSTEEGIVLTGIPEVDQANRLYSVISSQPACRKITPLIEKYNLDLIYLFIFQEKKIDVEKVAEFYKRLPGIKDALPNYGLPVDRIPNDPLFGNQWHLPKMMCPEAWDFTIGDTTVSLAVIDQGVDYGHQDLSGSFWINRAEDLNNNGRFDTFPPPEGDLDGVDQDGNGYPDDVIGFDMMDGDPNPMPDPGSDHGTICHGIACARTDNGIGVASVGWQIRGMNLRCGTGGYIYIYPAISGIIYAAQNGAFAISNSWGGSSYIPQVNSAIQFAWESGCVISASAGNEYSGGAPRYPACYDNVIATAASDRNDWHSVWGGGQQSNYADWVDVSAPGSGVLTTTNNNGYGAYDGTSMSSPCVAGQAALMKAAFPQMTNEECTTRIFLTCDPMPDTLYAQGLLGHGRINVGKAILSQVWSNLNVVDLRINDRGGNNNGVPEPGEICALIVTLENANGWQNATNITATLHTAHPNMEIIKNSARFPDIPAGGRGDCSQDSFVFRLQASAPPQRVKFIMTKSSTPRSLYLTDSIKVTCGFPRIILIDDDAGQNYERWYKAACDSLSLLYKIHEVSSQGVPLPETLNRYPVVIWWTGLDSVTSLTSQEQQVLQNYLDNGGKLFISGSNIGQDIGSEPFYANYLKAQYLQNSSGVIYIYGVPGDPIGVGDSIVVGGSGGANNGRTNDCINPVGGAVATHYYRGLPSTYAGIRYDGGYKLVYFAFPFEAVNHTTRYVQKPELLRRILLYFGEQLPYGLEEKKEFGARSSSPSLRIQPNPFKKGGRVSFHLPFPHNLTLQLYTHTGQKIKTLYSGFSQGGSVLLPSDLGSGIYFLELETAFLKERIKLIKIN